MLIWTWTKYAMNIFDRKAAYYIQKANSSPQIDSSGRFDAQLSV